MSLLKIFSLFALLCIHVQPICSQHFITDLAARERMLARYEERVFIFQDRVPGLFNNPDTIRNQTLREATMFLLAYAPLSDLANLDINYYRRQAELALQTRETFAWGRTIPEDVFRYFVLPYRVNNENPDTARSVFLKELLPRVQGLSMYDAALEVNHWCHEKVAYQGTDERTSSPLATVLTAFGRCGEESTFTVAAMRSVGIPARQVYTPRWAHTDDNHAWVEVWIDGKWYFLGACEPAPELNMGWFAGPATRTIMVHTNTFGYYAGSEKALVQTPLYSKLNLLSNYAPVRTAIVKVIDENGIAIPNIDVDFMVYNYAEFYPFATIKTSNDGTCSIETGFGDLLVWATNNESYIWGELPSSLNDTLQLMLPKNPIPFASCDENIAYCMYDMNFVPPPMGNIITPASNKADINELRLVQEDSIRGKYESSFPDSASVIQLINDERAPLIAKLVHKSRGNYATIIHFYNTAPSRLKCRAFELLSSISDKDLRDVPEAVLLDHLLNADVFKCIECNDHEIFVRYVLSPRIGKEFLTAWRGMIQKYFSKRQIKTFRKNPALLADWVRSNITIDSESNYYGTPLSPEGVLKVGLADEYSRNIFFVACCRSFGIPARLEPATNAPQYFADNCWHSAFSVVEGQFVSKGALILRSSRKNKPRYTTDFTIAKLVDGRFSTLDYEFDQTLLNFPCTLSLDPGTYRLMTGNRQDNGSVYTHWSFFDIISSDTTSIQIAFNDPEIRVEGFFYLDIDSITLNAVYSDLIVKPRDLNTENGMVLALIDPTTEPGKHFLSELQETAAEFEIWQGRILLVLREDRAALNTMQATFPNLPSNAIWLLDEKGDLQLKLSPHFEAGIQLPVVLYLSKKGLVTYVSQGYQINTAQMLLHTMQRFLNEERD